MIEEDDWKLAELRLETMPTNLQLSIGNYGILDKKELLEHLSKRDEIGKLVVQSQIQYLRYFKKELEKNGK